MLELYVMYKDFPGWHLLKAELERGNRPLFEERQVWWTSIGVNVGDEEDGKNERFNRPVIILRKFNSNLFVGVPMTTQTKRNPYYVEIEFRNRQQSVMISHIRTLDAKRLSNRIGRLSKADFLRVRDAVRNLL